MREGLMMDDYPLSLTAIVERAERHSADRPVVFRRPERVGRAYQLRRVRAASATARRGPGRAR